MYHAAHVSMACRAEWLAGQWPRFSDEEVAAADERDRLLRRRLSQLGINELTAAAGAVAQAAYQPL